MQVHNVMEEFVEVNVNNMFNSIKELKPAWFSCDCENCRLDTVSYVLNRIPPKYIVSGRGVTYSVQDLENQQLKADLDSVIIEGMKLVNSSKRPYHDVSPNSFLDSSKPSYNFSIFTGNIIDGSNFEPISNATILLKLNGKNVSMFDSTWLNPCTTESTTNGTYSFMVKPILAEKEGIQSKFNFSIEVSAPSYAPQTYYFTITQNSDSFTKTEIDSSSSYKIETVTLFKDFIENPME